VKSWEPRRNPHLTALRFVDVSGSDPWQLWLTKDGSAYLQGTVSWMDIVGPDPTLVSTDPVHFVIAMATSTDLFALLYSDGSVVACGGPFGKVPLRLCQGHAERIAATKQSVIVSIPHALLVFTAPTASTRIDLGTLSVRSLAAYDPGYLVLLDDGLLYCNFEVRELSRKIESSVPHLHIVTGFIGPPMIWIDTSLDEIICVYQDGSMVYGWADQENLSLVPALATLPVFRPPGGAQLCQMHISRDLLWLLTSRKQVFYIWKLPWLDQENGRISRFKPGPTGFPANVTHFKATWNDIYFFTSTPEEPPRHPPILRDPSLFENLPQKTEQFTIHSNLFGDAIVDPLGATEVGLRPGDRVLMGGDKEVMVVGATGRRLVVVANGGDVTTVEFPSFKRALFEWELRARPNGRLETICVTMEISVQVDSSNAALQRVCFFKARDLIVGPAGESAEVLGERCECLWIQMDGQVQMCSHVSSLALHRFWKLKYRKDVTVCAHQEASGGIILTEKRNDGPFSPGSIVASKTYGIGVFMGVAGDSYVVAFVSDSGACRLTPREHSLTVLRALSTHIVNAVSLNASHLPLNVAGVAGSPLLPCDVIRIEEELAFFVGTANGACFFETQIIIANDLGVGTLDLHGGFRLVCEISAVARPRQFMTSNGAIDLNVNLSDFRSFPLLPLDIISIGNRFAEVCGFKDNDLYIQFAPSRFVEKLNATADFDLVYRRVPVPTMKTFLIAPGKSVDAWIDLEHFRGCRCLPYDVIDYQGRRMIVQGVVGESKFVVADWETLDYCLFRLPIGKTQNVIRSIFGAVL
jgi:hypothetical protein